MPLIADVVWFAGCLWIDLLGKILVSINAEDLMAFSRGVWNCIPTDAVKSIWGGDRQQNFAYQERECMKFPPIDWHKQLGRQRWLCNSTGSRRLTPNMETFPQDKVNILGYRILSKKKAKLGTFYLLYQFYWQIYGEINVSMHQNREKQQQKHVLSPKWRRKGRGILQNIHLTIG